MKKQKTKQKKWTDLQIKLRIFNDPCFNSSGNRWKKTIRKNCSYTNLLRSHLRCVTHDCDRPFRTPNNNDQQMLRNFDVFRPPLTADCRNCTKCGSSDSRDRFLHSQLAWTLKHNSSFFHTDAHEFNRYKNNLAMLPSNPLTYAYFSADDDPFVCICFALLEDDLPA